MSIEQTQRTIDHYLLPLNRSQPDAPAWFMIIPANVELVALRVVHEDVSDQGPSGRLRESGARRWYPARPARRNMIKNAVRSHEQDHRMDTSIGTSPDGRSVT
jgi:hypothetical protein